MSEWKEVRLKDVCDKITVGHVGSMADKYQLTGIPFLRSLNIKPYRIDYNELKYIDEQFNNKLKKSILKPNDVAIVRTGYPGTACVIPKSLGVANCSDLVIVRPGKNLNPHFLAAIFNSTFGKDLVSGNLVGAAQQHFNITVAKELKLQLPSKGLQDKIAAILSAYDDLIENNRRRIALLEKMAEEIYREWFVRLRFPGYEQVKFHKGVPEGWELVKFETIANFIMGQSPKSEFYNDLGDGLPFNQGVGTYGERFPRKEIYCSVEGRTASKGDILFSVRAPVGRLNIADCKMIIGRGLAAIKHKKNCNSFLFYLLRNCFSNEDIIGNGSIFNSVGKDELASLKILIPKEYLILKYNDTAKTIDLKIENLYKSLELLKKSHDRLLTRLISGKLSVEDLDIQFPPSMSEEPLS